LFIYLTITQNKRHVLGKSHDDHMIYIVPKGHFPRSFPLFILLYNNNYNLGGYKSKKRKNINKNEKVCLYFTIYFLFNYFNITYILLLGYIITTSASRERARRG
jgi:hypothetical protein